MRRPEGACGRGSWGSRWDWKIPRRGCRAGRGPGRERGKQGLGIGNSAGKGAKACGFDRCAGIRGDRDDRLVEDQRAERSEVVGVVRGGIARAAIIGERRDSPDSPERWLGVRIAGARSRMGSPPRHRHPRRRHRSRNRDGIRAQSLESPGRGREGRSPECRRSALLWRGGLSSPFGPGSMHLVWYRRNPLSSATTDESNKTQTPNARANAFRASVPPPSMCEFIDEFL